VICRIYISSNPVMDVLSSKIISFIDQSKMYKLTFVILPASSSSSSKGKGMGRIGRRVII
jgi:hypothetical protein